MKTLAAAGENAIVKRLRAMLPGRRDLKRGAGDDCAVVSACGRGFDLLLTSDPVIEGVHFSRESPDAAVGHKALGRVLSDIAAMGGEPLWALIDVVAPPGCRQSRITGIYRGLARTARRWNVAIAGGDLARGPCLELHAFCVGRVPSGRSALRSGARPGDLIGVTGRLGGSPLGRHLRFEPRLAEGAWLRDRVSAMMDLSDGLATDLPRLLEESRAGAVLDAATIPVSAAARRAGGGMLPLSHALCDGEDFELLFTVRREKAPALIAGWKRRFKVPCTLIGEITARPGALELETGQGRRFLSETGYEHFS
jgi:thiamine-monophosphate kinase